MMARGDRCTPTRRPNRTDALTADLCMLCKTTRGTMSSKTSFKKASGFYYQEGRATGFPSTHQRAISGLYYRKSQTTGFLSTHQRAICDAVIISNKRWNLEVPPFSISKYNSNMSSCIGEALRDRTRDYYVATNVPQEQALCPGSSRSFFGIHAEGPVVNQIHIWGNRG